jgi:hypothetical protein
VATASSGFEAPRGEPGSPSRVGGEAGLRVLFLDDDPARAELFLARYPEAVWVETACECVDRLAAPWDEVHLDHDLGGERFVDSSRSDCGMEVVRWLCAEMRDSLRQTQFIIHSHNVNAADLMVRSLLDTGYMAAYRPFSIDLLDWLQFDEPAEPSSSSGVREMPPSSKPWISRLVEILRSSMRAGRAAANDQSSGPSRDGRSKGPGRK